MKGKILTFCIRAAFWVSGLIPRSMAILMGRFLGWMMQHVIRFRRDIVLENLEQVYGSRESWPDDILRRIYRHFGLLAIEMLCLPSLTEEGLKKKIHYHNFHYVDEALEKNNGLMAISGHIGNWEYGIAGLAQCGYRPHVVVKKLKDIDNDYLFERLRGSKGVTSILKDKAVLALRRALKKNSLVVVVIDQNSKRGEGTFVDHFGKQASTYSAPGVLSRKFKSPTLPVFSYRDENLWDHHVVAFPEIKQIETGSSDQENLRLNTQEYIRVFEEFLMKYPEQWIWMHRRWKTQPK